MRRTLREWAALDVSLRLLILATWILMAVMLALLAGLLGRWALGCA